MVSVISRFDSKDLLALAMLDRTLLRLTVIFTSGKNVVDYSPLLIYKLHFLHLITQVV